MSRFGVLLSAAALPRRRLGLLRPFFAFAATASLTFSGAYMSGWLWNLVLHSALLLGDLDDLTRSARPLLDLRQRLGPATNQP